MRTIIKMCAVLLSVSICTQMTWAARCVYEKPMQAEVHDIGVMLKWMTAEEYDMKLFLIQRSNDGVDFYTLGKVDCKGSKDKKANYTFLDVAAGAKHAYYRLQEVGIDGTTTYSSTVEVKRRTDNNLVITSIEDTRLTSHFLGQIYSSGSGTLEFEIKTVTGKVLKKGSHAVYEGDNKLAMSFEELIPATYELIFSMDGEKEKLIVQKVKGKTGNKKEIKYFK